MRFSLDHVVVAFHDLEKAIAQWQAQGYTVVRGGRHPGRTSHNAIVPFADGSYVELIAWAEPGRAERWYDMLTTHGEGLMDFALLPESGPRAIPSGSAVRSRSDHQSSRRSRA